MTKMLASKKEHNEAAREKRSSAVAVWVIAGTAYFELAEHIERNKRNSVKKSKVVGDASFFYQNAAHCFQRALRWGIARVEREGERRREGAKREKERGVVLSAMSSRADPSAMELGSECRVLLWYGINDISAFFKHIVQ